MHAYSCARVHHNVHSSQSLVAGSSPLIACIYRFFISELILSLECYKHFYKHLNISLYPAAVSSQFALVRLVIVTANPRCVAVLEASVSAHVWVKFSVCGEPM